MFNIDHTDSELLGYIYWQVGDYKTISKIAALEKAGGDISKVQFHWMDDTWSKTDMTKEPLLSWNDLLKLRAQQLRDTYSHVILCYSGGWDSHTALMSFVDNNILLDEIILWDRRSYMHDNEFADALATVKQIVSDYRLKTKITVFNIPWDYHADVFTAAGKDYIYLPGCQLCFNQTTRLVKHDALPEFVDIKNQHKGETVCFIEAHDKPRINLWDGKWYQFYIDSAMYVYVGAGETELFYLTPDLPELHLKQLYMSIRYFENLLKTTPGATGDLVHQVQSFNHAKLYAEWNRHIGRTCSNNYSAINGLAKRNDVYHSNKAELLKLTSFTKVNMKKTNAIYDGGLQTINEMTGLDVINGSMPGIMTKQYYIKDFSK
jgi:hypothetical protein